MEKEYLGRLLVAAHYVTKQLEFPITLNGPNEDHIVVSKPKYSFAANVDMHGEYGEIGYARSNLEHIYNDGTSETGEIHVLTGICGDPTLFKYQPGLDHFNGEPRSNWALFWRFHPEIEGSIAIDTDSKEWSISPESAEKLEALSEEEVYGIRYSILKDGCTTDFTFWPNWVNILLGKELLTGFSRSH